MKCKDVKGLRKLEVNYAQWGDENVYCYPQPHEVLVEV